MQDFCVCSAVCRAGVVRHWQRAQAWCQGVGGLLHTHLQVATFPEVPTEPDPSSRQNWNVLEWNVESHEGPHADILTLRSS